MSLIKHFDVAVAQYLTQIMTASNVGKRSDVTARSLFKFEFEVDLHRNVT